MTLSLGVADDAVDAGQGAAPPARGLVFTARWRIAGVAYVALTAPLCGARFAGVRGEPDYLLALVLVGTVYWLPGFVIALIASARTDPADRRLWRVWAALFGSGLLLAPRAASIDDAQLATLHTVAVPVTVAFCLALTVSNTVLLRTRSGERAVSVDALDLIVAAVAVAIPLACLFGESIVESSSAWFTVSAAFWALTAAYCTAALVLVRRRLPPQHRSTADAGIVIGMVGLANAVAQVIYGVHDFTLPAGFFIGMHALSIGMTGLCFLWAARQRSSGLERLTRRAQVRGRPTITLVVLASVPVTAAIVWARRDSAWVITVAVIAGLVLVVLTSVRVLVSARETARLYRRVEQADDERRDLLNQVMVHADADRHRVAAHLHRQSAALYTAMASLTMMFERADDGNPTGPGLAAERLTADLARQSDELRRLAVAVRPIEPAPDNLDSHPLVAPIKAFVDRLYCDARRPEVVVRVDPAVDLEWTTEAIVLRIVQEAILNAWRHAGASSIEVAIGVDGRGTLTVDIADDGVGFDREAVGGGGTGMAALRTMARFLDAEVRYDTEPRRGTTVHVVAAADDPPAPRRPRLRVVSDS